MKELLVNIITKTIDYTKTFFDKTTDNIKFEESKNVVMKAMYNSILEKKIEEKNILLSELNNIKKEQSNLNKKTDIIKEENMLYNKKINALNSFQQFLLDNQN